MRAFAIHLAFEFKTGLRNPTMFFMNYLFPLGVYAILGLVMTQVNPPFADSMIPAMMTFCMMASAILGMPGPMVEAREAGIYRSFKINGVPAFSILVIPIVTTMFHAIIVAGIVAVTGGSLFGAALPVHWGALVWIALLAAFTFAAVGALIGVVSADSRATVLWSQLIFLPSMLLGGLMMPLGILPPAVRSVAHLLPPAHAMQSFLGFAYEQETAFDPWRAVLVLLGSGLLALGLAIYLFNWDSKNKSRRGHPLMALLVLIPYVIGML